MSGRRKAFSGMERMLSTIEKLPGAGERQRAAEEVLSSIIEFGYPHFEGENEVYLFYRGARKSVSLLGDMGNWAEYIPCWPCDRPA